MTIPSMPAYDRYVYMRMIINDWDSCDAKACPSCEIQRPAAIKSDLRFGGRRKRPLRSSTVVSTVTLPSWPKSAEPPAWWVRPSKAGGWIMDPITGPIMGRKQQNTRSLRCFERPRMDYGNDYGLTFFVGKHIMNSWSFIVGSNTMDPIGAQKGQEGRSRFSRSEALRGPSRQCGGIWQGSCWEVQGWSRHANENLGRWGHGMMGWWNLRWSWTSVGRFAYEIPGLCVNVPQWNKSHEFRIISCFRCFFDGCKVTIGDGNAWHFSEPFHSRDIWDIRDSLKIGQDPMIFKISLPL